MTSVVGYCFLLYSLHRSFQGDHKFDLCVCNVSCVILQGQVSRSSMGLQLSIPVSLVHHKFIPMPVLVRNIIVNNVVHMSKEVEIDF